MANRLPQREPLHPTPLRVPWDTSLSTHDKSPATNTTRTSKERTLKTGDRRKREDQCADWGALWASATQDAAHKSTNEPVSRQSQIEALQSRLEKQDLRIAELKAQALSARREIDTLTFAKANLALEHKWTREDLARAKRDYTTDLTRAKGNYTTDLARAKGDYKTDIARMERFYKSDLVRHKTELASFRAFFTESLIRDVHTLAELQAHQETLNVLSNRSQSEALTVQIPQPALGEAFDAPFVLTHPMKSVEVVGEARLHGCGDVLPIITGFLLRVPLAPLDVAVRREFVHMTKWLVTNGAKSSSLTAHAAVNSGNLEIVQAVFSSIDEVESRPEVFQALPIDKSEKIAHWLIQKYPGPMAKELVRLSTIDKMPRRSQWVWQAERMELQWQWEQDFEAQCLNRKRQRLEQAL